MSELLETVAKRIFILCLVIAVAGASVLYGAVAYRDGLPPIPQLKMVQRTISGLIGSPRFEHLQPARGQGDDVTINAVPNHSDFVFMAGFFDDENQARLIKRDGSIVKKWSLNYFTHFPEEHDRTCSISSPLQTDVHGALVTPSGELVFNYEYCGTVKLDQCGNVIWKIAKATHHSIVPAESGGYWLLARHQWLASEAPARLPPFSTPGMDSIINEDTLLRISEAGGIIEEISIPNLLRENNLEALLTANGMIFQPDRMLTDEPVHANKVAELPSEIAASFPLFSAGDLAISLRALNLVFVISPDTKKVKWYQTGPWLRQHDPEFRADGKISIFNNNVYRTAYVNGQTALSTPFSTNIMTINPVTRHTAVVFGEKPGQEMLSVIRGQHEILQGYGILITEFDAGRVLEVNTNGEIVWEYVNHYDDDFVGEIANAAIYPVNYFNGVWQSCER